MNVVLAVKAKVWLLTRLAVGFLVAGTQFEHAQGPDTLRQARELVQRSEYQHARQLLEKAVTAGVASEDANLLLAAINLKLGEPARAIPPAERALRANPGNPAARLTLADALLQADRATEAQILFLELVGSPRQATEAWFGLAKSSLLRAREADRQLQSVAPQSPYSKVVRMARTQSGAEATRLFGELLKSSPETPGIWQNLGEYAFAQGSLPEARSCFLKALQQAPWSVRSHFGLACLDAAEHDVARARDRLHQIPAINPTWISLRGRSLLPPALRDSLKAAITPAVDAAPLHPPRSCVAGSKPMRCWVEAGFVETAWPEAVKQLSMRQAASAELYYWRAIGFEQLGSMALDRLLETPASARGLTLAAQIFVWLKQYQQAAEILHRALQIEPANGEAWTSLGKVQRHNVELEDAENSLLKGIQFGHRDAEAYFMLGEIYARRHEPQQALIFLEQSLKLHRPTDALQTILAKVYGELGEDSKQIAHLLMIPPERRTPPVLYQLYQAYERTGQTALARQALADYRRSKDQETKTR